MGRRIQVGDHVVLRSQHAFWDGRHGLVVEAEGGRVKFVESDHVFTSAPREVVRRLEE